ncbi:hypothetical protein J9303_14385 [Bacillaceae bacterium Marseille-Q3522]|nr:hypothetical protein [Bacillaceae bacterium Marseille-Q3522]
MSGNIPFSKSKSPVKAGGERLPLQDCLLKNAAIKQADDVSEQANTSLIHFETAPTFSEQSDKGGADHEKGAG